MERMEACFDKSQLSVNDATVLARIGEERKKSIRRFVKEFLLTELVRRKTNPHQTRTAPFYRSARINGGPNTVAGGAGKSFLLASLTFSGFHQRGQGLVFK